MPSWWPTRSRSRECSYAVSGSPLSLFFEGKPVAGLVSAPLDVIAIVVLQVVWPC
jgi:hypothetical protein